MSERTIQTLQSLGCSAPATSSVIDLRPATDNEDDTTFMRALLDESREAAIETYGAASFCVGNVADDTEVEDVGVLLPSTEGGKTWDALVNGLGIDLSSFDEPKILDVALDEPSPGIIKGSKLYNLLAQLDGLQKVTVATSDESVLLVAWIGRRQSTGTVIALLGATETT